MINIASDRGLMFKIDFYRNNKGESELVEFIQNLNEKANTNKDARIMLKQIVLHINILSKTGTYSGATFVKHIAEDIWELRPGKNRILFFAWYSNKIVLLHYFLKTTQKTPKYEIEKAKREISDWMERNEIHEKQ